MARVLLGWELGGNRGHIVKLRDLAARLRENGHRVSFAVQDPEAVAALAKGQGDIVRAPLPPRSDFGQPRLNPPAAHGDILGRLGFGDSELVATTLLDWDRILTQLAPDVVVAEYAPWLLLAARRSLPTIAAGNGFTLPPDRLGRFPSLTGAEPAMREEVILDSVNRGLAQAGREVLDRLPAIYSASRAVVATYEEFDPYCGLRTMPLAPPHLGSPLPPLSRDGDEIFVTVAAGPESRLWEGLESSGLPVRVHLPRHRPALAAALERRGFRVEKEPLPFRLIAERSRLLVSHGGLGTVSSGLTAGLPQVVCHYDLEKALTGRAIARLGVGGHVSLQRLKPDLFAASLRRAYEDEAIAARARQAAPGYRARHSGRGFVERVLDAVEELA